MKRHVQEPGVRKWSGNDLLDLQSEPLRIMDDFFGQWGDCVICGCAVSENAIGAGLVSIGGMVMPLSSAEVATFPLYLVADVEHVQREYADDVVRDIALRRFAKVVYSEPEEGVPYILVTAEGAAGFFDGMRASWLTDLAGKVANLQDTDRTHNTQIASLLSLTDSLVRQTGQHGSSISSLQTADTVLAGAIDDLAAANRAEEARIGTLEGKAPREIDHVPGVADDGFSIGQEVWVVGADLTKTFYKCHDNTPGAAVWHEIGEGGSGAHSGAVFLAGADTTAHATVLINQGYID